MEQLLLVCLLYILTAYSNSDGKREYAKILKHTNRFKRNFSITSTPGCY